MSEITHKCSAKGECFCLFDPECNTSAVAMSALPTKELVALHARVGDLENALVADAKLIAALRELAEARGYNQSSQWAVDAEAAYRAAHEEFIRARSVLSKEAAGD